MENYMEIYSFMEFSMHTYVRTDDEDVSEDIPQDHSNESH